MNLNNYKLDYKLVYVIPFIYINNIYYLLKFEIIANIQIFYLTLNGA